MAFDQLDSVTILNPKCIEQPNYYLSYFEELVEDLNLYKDVIEHFTKQQFVKETGNAQ